MKRLLAVTGISGLLVMGVAGVAQASPDRGAQGGSVTVASVDRSGSSNDHHGSSKDHSGSKDHGKKHDHSKGKDHSKNHK